eukprot:351775-Chlamydomonas_euryale.AAC.2
MAPRTDDAPHDTPLTAHDHAGPAVRPPCHAGMVPTKRVNLLVENRRRPLLDRRLLRPRRRCAAGPSCAHARSQGPEKKL